MAVGDGENFEHALQRTVLARPPVQHIEGEIRLDGGQHCGDVAADVDAGHLMSEPRERLGAGLARAQRDLALGRPTSHQNGDVLAHPCSTSTAVLIRLYHPIESRSALASSIRAPRSPAAVERQRRRWSKAAVTPLRSA